MVATPKNQSSQIRDRGQINQGTGPRTVTTFVSQRCRASVRIIIYTCQHLVSIPINATMTFSPVNTFNSPLSFKKGSGAQN